MKNLPQKAGIVLLLLLLTACTNNEGTSIPSYLSFTLTYEKVGENGKVQLWSDLYSLAIDGKSEAVLRGTIPYERDYPIGIYHAETNSLIYSGISDIVNGNQIYKRDLGSGETEMLTRDFAYLTHIIPIADEVLLIGGVVKGAENIAVQLYELDITTKALTKVSWDSDFDVRGIFFDSACDSLLVQGYSYSDDRRRILNQDATPYTSGDSYIFEYKDRQATQLVVLPAQHLLSFYREGDEIYYVNERLRLSGINQKTLEKCKGRFVFGGAPYYDSERERLYFISGGREIRFYDIRTQEFITVFESGMTKSAINNMTFVKGR